MSQREYSRRLSDLQENIKASYFALYEPYGATNKDFKRFLAMLAKSYANRKSALRKIDLNDRQWAQSAQTVGLTLYVDLYAKNLAKLKTKLPYLQELGITLVHLMPLYESAASLTHTHPGVVDFYRFKKEYGDWADLESLCDSFRKEGIYVSIDFNMNQVSIQHQWAQKALQGDVEYQKYFIMVDDIGVVNAYNKMVPEAMPIKEPGNFTFVKALNKYAFTTFTKEEWDLNYKNPAVFEEMLGTLLELSNLGVGMIRLNGLPFLWKQVGTTCRNLPQVHQLLELLRLVVQVVCPSLVLVGEAHVDPHEVIRYFGNGESPQCEYMTNSTMMINTWNALATRDTRLLNIDMQRTALQNNANWLNYIRNYDAIQWTFNEAAALALNWSPEEHKQFLIQFYAGEFEGSFANGQRYEFNPKTLDTKINGTFASLIGAQRSLEEHDVFGAELAVKKMRLVVALLCAQRGIPMLQAGDELALFNDVDYIKDPMKARDGRWMQRFKYDPAQYLLSAQPNFHQAYFESLKNLLALRKEEPLFDNDNPTYNIATSNHSIFSFWRSNESDLLVALFNFSEYPQKINTIELKQYGIQGEFVEMVQGKRINLAQKTIYLHPYEFMWLKKQ
ncbi:MAG: alpha-amylase family glycosyl hydrolase [Erysipelotrichaceae bacterium]